MPGWHYRRRQRRQPTRQGTPQPRQSLRARALSQPTRDPGRGVADPDRRWPTRRWPVRWPAAPAGTGAVLAAVLVGLWAVAATWLVNLPAWGLASLLRVWERPVPGWFWPVTAWSTAVLAGVPALLLWRLPRAPAVRATGRLWTWGALLAGLFGSARAVPLVHPVGYLAVLAGGATLAAAIAGRATSGVAVTRWATPGVAVTRWATPGVAVAGRATPGTGSRLPRGDSRAFAAGAGLACLAAWLCLGALGGLAGTLCAAVAAIALGVLTGRLLDVPWWAGMAGAGPGSRAPLVWCGGLTAWVFLTLLAAGTGSGGVQLAEMLVLPPLGFAAATLARRDGAGWRARRDRATSLLVGLTAFGPLAFLAPTQLALQVNLGTRDVGFWALCAAGCGFGTALLAGLGYGLSPHRDPPRWVGALVAVALAAGALTGYAVVGSPGLHGDKLFVVMRARADLTGLPADPVARRSEVYRRLVATARRSQAEIRAELSRLHLSFTPYYLVNGLEVAGGPAVRALLAARSDVDRVLSSPHLRPVPATGGPMRGSQAAVDGPTRNVTMIHADRVWATGDTGRGILVGTSDTGVDGDHPALAGSYRGGDDSWYDPWNGTRTPTDHRGHGTHTLGTAVGSGGIGVAPGARWIGCVDLDRNLGNPAYYLACLQFMLAPFPHGGDPLRDGRPDRGAQVLTNSWACPGLEGCDRDALRPAIDALTAAGVFVVAAAGNSGPRCGSIADPPAPYPDTFTVGAVTADGRVAGFSSRGPVPGAVKPDVLAPGVSVLSALPGGGYGRLSGTSTAAPAVAGVVALMWSAAPGLVGDVGTTARILRDTAVPVPGQDCAGTRPAGLVDAEAAVRAAAALPAAG